MTIFQNVNSRNHDLVVSSIEPIKDSIKFKHARLVEAYVVGECNGWCYSLDLELMQLRYWKSLSNGEFEVDYIELASIDNDGNITGYVEKIELDGTEIYNKEHYDFKTYLYHSEDDDVYYMDDYLAPKEDISMPNETEQIVSNLRKSGHLIDTDEIFKKLVEIANTHYDGHFTLMKFTTNWRCGFSTPNEWFDIQEMCMGRTQDQAMILAIQKHYLDTEE